MIMIYRTWKEQGTREGKNYKLMPPTNIINGIQGGYMWLKCNDDRSPPATTKFVITWNFTSMRLVHLHDMVQASSYKPINVNPNI
jgi:hypothetical protein